MEIVEQIKILRELNNLSQEKLAVKIHMTREGYAKIERGERGLTVSRLQQIAEALNVSLPELLSIDETSRAFFINDNHFCIFGKETSGAIYHNNSLLKLQAQIDNLQLSLNHRDEIIEQKNKEIQLLKDTIDILKSK